MPPSVGSASPSVTCVFEMSCTADQSRAIPSEPQSVTNLATVAGAAGQKTAPLISHQRANMGAARRRAWASAASTGLLVNRMLSCCFRVLSPGLAQSLVHVAHLLAQADQPRVLTQRMRARADLAAQLGIDIL